MESKKKINNLMSNKNGFLITCVCSIVLLLTLCYFGINSSFKGTSAMPTTICLNGRHLVSSGDTQYCCPEGTNEVMEINGDKYCVDKTKEARVDYTGTASNDDNETPLDEAVCSQVYGSGWYVYVSSDWNPYSNTALSDNDGSCAYHCGSWSFGANGTADCYKTCKFCYSKEHVVEAYVITETDGYCYMSNDQSTPNYSYGKFSDVNNASSYIHLPEFYNREEDCLENNVINYIADYNNGEPRYQETKNAVKKFDAGTPTQKKITTIAHSNGISGLSITNAGIEYFPKFIGYKFQSASSGANTSFAKSAKGTYQLDWKQISLGDVTTDKTFMNLSVTRFTTVIVAAQWEELTIQLPTVVSLDGKNCRWNTKANGNGDFYESGGKYITTSETPVDLELYAICEPEDSGDENTTTCPAGQYYYGQGECNVCPENYYCPERTYVGEDDPYAGTSGWMACPAGTSSPKGSDSIDDCVAQNSNFNSASVKITGTNKVGEKLTATVTTDPTGAKCTYQWYYGTSSSMTATSGSTAINGATSNTYFITDNMVDKYIYVIATCVKDGYNEKKVSDITDTVVAAKVVTGGICDGSVEYNYKDWDSNGDGSWTVNECNDAIVSGKLSVWNKDKSCCLIRDRYSINYNYNGGKKGGDDPNFGIVDGQITTELGYYGYDYVSINYPSKKVIITGNQNNTGADVGAATSANQTFAGWTFNGNTSSAKYGTSSSSITTVWDSTSTKAKAKYFRNLTTTSGATVTMTAHWTPVSLYVPTLTSPSGYTCVWNTKSDGSGKPYTSGEQYTPTENSEANITLYARCTKIDIQEPTTKVATIPTAASYCQTLTYNKTTQTLTKAAGDGYTFANNTRVNAGSQKVRAVLMSGYKWSDGTTTYKEFSCSIAKANPTLSLAEYRVSLTEGGSSSVDYSYDGDGVVGCDSRNTSIAVCEEKNGKLVITAKAAGITEILLTATSGINYNSSSTNAVSVTVVEDTSDIPKEEYLTATFNANGGVLSGGNNRFCKKTSSSCDVTDLPTATRDGYTFKGWGIENTCNSGEKEKITLNKDTSYYACWVKVENTPNVDDDGNVEDNVQTGNVVIMLVLCLGLLAMGYAYYYFKSIKQN